MDGVLSEATVLCLCKLACSLLFLPSLAHSDSPVSFCCCCLLVFTDFLVTGFLTLLYFFGSWLSDLTLHGDVIALRFLLFLCHTYGVVLLLTTPLIALENVTRLLWPDSGFRTAGQSADGQRCSAERVTVEEEEEEDEEEEDSLDRREDRRLSHAVSYLCCLSLWVVVALNVKWRWKQEEVWVVACLRTTHSLIRCMPNMFSHTPTLTNCLGFICIFLLLCLLTKSMGLHNRRHWPPPSLTHKEKHSVNNGSRGCCWQGLAPARPAPSKPPSSGTLISKAAQCVDPEKTESSCTVHSAYSQNVAQMSTRHHGDFVLVPPEYLSAERGGQEPERTKGSIPLTFITGEHVDSQCSWQSGWREWGFPCLGVNVMIGIVGVLSVWVLPLNLSVNILLIRSIETLLVLCINYLLSPPANSTLRPPLATHHFYQT